MRITGGTFRSRALRAPRGDRTRPTSDRVREALFSMLASGGLLFEGASVLDLYAGSGALAFEALSRGAGRATLVEEAPSAIAVIRANAVDLGVADRVLVVRGSVERAVSKLEGPFDLALVDPPYALVRAAGFEEVLSAVAEKLAPEGGLVLEHSSDDPPPLVPGLAIDRSRRHGDTTLSLYRKTSLP